VLAKRLTPVFYGTGSEHAKVLAIAKGSTGSPVSGAQILLDFYNSSGAAEGPGSVRRLHSVAGAALTEGLRRLGVPAALAPGGPAHAPDAGPCFRTPAAGEVIVGGRKLVGSAQVRLEGKLLQHGSILLQDDQRLLARLVASPRSATAEPASSTHLGAWLDPVPSWDALVEVFTSAFRDTLGGDWHGASAAITLDPALVESLERHYHSSAWTWRR
jgi:lipoate-protein ligase A